MSVSRKTNKKKVTLYITLASSITTATPKAQYRRRFGSGLPTVITRTRPLFAAFHQPAAACTTIANGDRNGCDLFSLSLKSTQPAHPIRRVALQQRSCTRKIEISSFAFGPARVARASHQNTFFDCACTRTYRQTAMVCANRNRKCAPRPLRRFVAKEREVCWVG